MQQVSAADLLQRVSTHHHTLAMGEAAELMRALLAGEFGEAQIATLLTALHTRGETAEELAGFAAAMRDAVTPLPLSGQERGELVDSCGTGGDGSGTFNISTAAALVAAAAGARVAKHGNRSITSRCGSADVLEALGIRIDHTPDSAAAALRTHGFAFLLAPSFHPAMRVVAPVRRSLPFRTVFNLLGPMTNPAGARRQVMGVYRAEAVTLVAEALALTGHMHHALVVHGEGPGGSIDELALSGSSQTARIRGTVPTFQVITPRDAGLVPSADRLQGGDAARNAAILRTIFAGEVFGEPSSPARDVVLLNAAAVLQVAGIADDLFECQVRAAHAIDSGAVTALVAALQR